MEAATHAQRMRMVVSWGLHFPEVEVKVVTTEHAKHFYDPKDIPAEVYSDSDEWKMWNQRADPVLHIELRRWADVMVIAPLDANTLGKIASGICDNLLTCIVRAWDLKRPLLFCPAMNTAMWEHPITAVQIQTLKSFGYIDVPCIVKNLVCGDEGHGAMAETSTIVEKVRECLDRLHSRGLGAAQQPQIPEKSLPM
ncbi:phosphopantothenoylcysteine decarboxylase isoform X2 [Narcine bancroftii]|uniref:phosphopantothenoylcysteine decarboxylase isoform X2 n=1 Tax=Narcine bancroftii TaxID=1343680 RepID=UPI003831B24D